MGFLARARAISINNYFQKEKENVLEALQCLKNAVEALPEIANGMGQFLNSYGELEKQRITLQQKEMEVLRMQVVKQAKDMIDAGQTHAARQIVEQLRMMFPGDAEVNVMLFF